MADNNNILEKLEGLVARFEEVIEWCKKGDVDFSKTKTVNLDEYVGLSAIHDQSYSYFMHHNFFDHINIDPRNTHLPNGLEEDEAKESLVTFVFVVFDFFVLCSKGRPECTF